MTETGPEPTGASEIDEVRADIAATRSDLAHTVDELSTRLDVKHRAAGAVSDAGRKVTDTATRAKRAAPEPVQHALDRAAEKTKPLVQAAKPHRDKIIAGVIVAVIVLVVISKRRQPS